jgi:AhpD family alkylhydroperoxidase
MARVEEKTGPMVRASQAYAKRKYGRPLTITPVIAHSGPTMIGWGAFEMLHERAHRVDERLKDLAATRVATIVGCEFCIDIGSALGRKAGVTEAQLRAFHDYRTSPEFSDEERVVMEYAEELTREQVQVPDELFARLREHFDEAQVVELTAAIAIENFRARFNNALDIEPSGFSDGMYCPMPAAAVSGAAEGANGQSEVRTTA